MCGIAGILNLDKKPAERGLVEKMTGLQKHRGPDASGFYYDRNVALGHCRLKIIDLTDKAHQPMQLPDRSVSVVYNGEIFNYLELKEELVMLGHKFITGSDTEVVLHAYRQWGLDAPTKFNGMWSFAIWDSRRNMLFCSRDRFGIKPFYYYFDGKRFVFASEIKAFFCDKTIPREPDMNAVFNYLGSGYGYMDTSQGTFFKNIRQLRPGHSLVITDKIDDINYWQLDAGRANNSRTFESIRDEFSELFNDAVKLWTRSDVPVGISLSGGLDSTSIAAVMSDICTNKIESFSACFEEPGYGEKAYINEMLKDPKFTPNFITPTSYELMNELHKIIRHQDEPFTGASIFSQWQIMKTAKSKGIKVLLTGQGSDEILAGYNKFYPFYYADMIRHCDMGGLLENMMKLGSGFGYNRWQALPEAVKVLASRAVPAGMKAGKKRAAFLDENFCRQYGRRNAVRKQEFGGCLRQELYNSITVSPLPALLHFDDRNSMAHSVESRPPFLDHRLVEFAFSMPDSAKIKGGFTKYVLRESMKGRLPELIRTRRDKMGFVTPMGEWFRKELKNEVLGLLSEERFKKRGIFDMNGVNNIIKEHNEGKRDHAFTIWSWVNLELWFRMYIDAENIQ